jgi:hypothetical protein
MSADIITNVKIGIANAKTLPGNDSAVEMDIPVGAS